MFDDMEKKVIKFVIGCFLGAFVFIGIVYLLSPIYDIYRAKMETIANEIRQESNINKE